MSGDPRYQPPRAPIESLVLEARGPVRIRAVLAGMAVDLVGTVLLGVGILLAADSFGLRDEEREALFGWGPASPWVDAVGALVSVVAGYVAGRVAGYAHARHGLLAVGLLLLAFVPIDMAEPDAAPLWYDVATYLATAGAGAFGGWLAGRGAARR